MLRDEEEYSDGDDFLADGTRRRLKENHGDISAGGDTSMENLFTGGERGHELEVNNILIALKYSKIPFLVLRFCLHFTI